MQMPGFTRTEIKTSGARIVTVHGGSGPPLLLLHGNPFTHLSWHKFAPRLAQEFTVVATDLRGYGDSEKPPSQPDHANYSFRAMAQDNVEVMKSLGFEKFFVAGHDRGARVTHRMCLDHPDKVIAASIQDIIPQHHLFNNVTQAWATGAYHWFFMIQAAPMPETLMSADPDFFITKKLSKTAQGLSFFGKEALAEYMRCFRNPETIHAICEDYRAAATLDRAHDEADRVCRRRIRCPTLVLWSLRGPLDAWYQEQGGPLALWRAWADDVEGRPLEGGHFFPESAPLATAEALSDFFRSVPAASAPLTGVNL